VTDATTSMQQSPFDMRYIVVNFELAGPFNYRNWCIYDDRQTEHNIQSDCFHSTLQYLA